MTYKCSHILLKSILTVLVASVCFTVSSQELPAKKHGTVLEQIKMANINNTQEQKIKDILDYAFQFRGVRYRAGSSSPSGFDCSGFTSFVFRKFGINLDRSSSAQVNDGRSVSRNELKPGDLVFFNGRAVGSRVGHVGIVTKVDEFGDGFTFIHASCSGGIRESHSSEAYYQRRYVGACRVLNE
jgi:cell wall-associated NlpC family hydrolase